MSPSAINLAEFDLPPPPRRFVISDVEAPKRLQSQKTIVIRIRKHLRVRDDRHSQVVLAQIQNSSFGSCQIGRQVVAKLFDPLFVSVEELPDKDARSKFRQIMTSRLCQREVAAYTRLSSLQGTATPTFHGKFDCRFPGRLTESDQTVNVILMEHIDGWPLSWYSPGEITQSQGQWIMRETEAIMRQIHCHGIIHHDLALRNFILTRLGRVVLIDFEESEVLLDENVYSHDILKKGDFNLLRREFEDLGLLPRSNSQGPPMSLFFSPATISMIAEAFPPACPNDLGDL
ncbi:hypothetical protein V1509DRAFT_642606 [Lipomyces kononenkoae]